MKSVLMSFRVLFQSLSNKSFFRLGVCSAPSSLGVHDDKGRESLFAQVIQIDVYRLFLAPDIQVDMGYTDTVNECALGVYFSAAKT